MGSYYPVWAPSDTPDITQQFVDAEHFRSSEGPFWNQCVTKDVGIVPHPLSPIRAFVVAAALVKHRRTCCNAGTHPHNPKGSK